MTATDSFARIKTPILVLGATSLIGRVLTPRLAASELDSVALSRKDMGEPGWVRGDLADPNLQAGLPHAPTVLSLSPIWLLAAALPALKAQGLQRLVAFSSTSVFTKAGSPDAYERDVAATLARGEADVRVFCEAHDVAWTILRPTLIYMEGQDRNISRLAGLIRRLGVLPLYGQGQGLRQPVHAADLADAALAVAASAAARNKAYDLPGGETLTYRQMAERVFEGLGRRPRIVTAPEWIWRLAFALARPVLPGATAQMGARMTEDLVFDGALAQTDFGWNSRRFHPRFKASI